MCCGTIAIDLTLLRRFTRMQLPPSGVRRRQKAHLGLSTCSHRPRRFRSASRRRGPRTTARGSKGCRKGRRGRDSTFAKRSRDYVVGGDRVDGSVDVPNVAKNHLAVAATTVARRHQVIAVAEPRHVAATRRRVALPFIRRSESTSHLVTTEDVCASQIWYSRFFIPVHRSEPVKSHFISWSWISFTCRDVISFVLFTSQIRQVPSLREKHGATRTSIPLR